jgi:hypothetical protein
VSFANLPVPCNRNNSTAYRDELELRIDDTAPMTDAVVVSLGSAKINFGLNEVLGGS